MSVLKKIQIKKVAVLLVLISFSSVLLAQEGSGIQFSEMSHYFGTFPRTQGLKKHTFTFKNTGSDPLIIKKVNATCGCTATDWTVNPVLPGQTGEIKVVFNPQKFGGYFSKRINVYTNRDNNVINLQISGRILVNNKVTDDFTHFIGDLKADKESIDFGTIEVGSSVVSKEIRLINIMRDSIRLEALKLPDDLKVEQTHEEIAPGNNCKLTFTFDPSEKGKWGNLDTVAIFKIARNAKTEIRKIPIHLIVTDAFSELGESQKLNAPAICISEENLPVFEETKEGKWGSQKIEITNNGNSELIIRRVEVGDRNIIVKKYDEYIAPGKAGRIILNYKNTPETKISKDELVVWNNSPDKYRFVIPLKTKTIL
ncbi:MAG: DUF1573 domain-containing protein [Draconibacterium sp.]